MARDVLSAPAMDRTVIATVVALVVGGCGPCPPSRVRKAEPESIETRSYEMQEDGTLELTVDGTTMPVEAWCDDACHAAFADPEVTCEDLCTKLSGFDELQSCAFDATHSALDCVIHHEAQDEQCNCSILDC